MKKIIAELKKRGFKQEAAQIEKILANIYSLLNFKGTDKEIVYLKKWLDSLRLSYGKAPKGLKEVFKDLQFLQRQFDVAKDFNIQVNTGNIKAVLSRWTKDTIDKIQNSLSDKEQIDLNLKNAIYINNSLLNATKFKELAQQLDTFLNTLKGFHKKALKKPLKIRFVKKATLKSKAQYKSNKDEIYIRPDYIKFNDNYGSFSYILVHELGHRYLKLFGKGLKNINFNYPKWFTTRYSETQTMSDEEPFAELFALSNWSSKYKEYKEKIDKFIKVLK